MFTIAASVFLSVDELLMHKKMVLLRDSSLYISSLPLYLVAKSSKRGTQRFLHEVKWYRQCNALVKAMKLYHSQADFEDYWDVFAIALLY